MSAFGRSATMQSPMIKQSDDNDEKLWLAARAGSQIAFAELQKSHSGRLYKRILSITRNHEDAEDVLQDTFLRAYLGLSSFEGRAKFSTWLTSIAINSALMTLRKRHARPEMRFDQAANAVSEVPTFEFPDESLNPEQFCEHKQRFTAIFRSMQRLEPKMRAVFDAWISQERSMKEVARDLGISTACVKARLHRARKYLKRSESVRSIRSQPLATCQTN